MKKDKDKKRIKDVEVEDIEETKDNDELVEEEEIDDEVIFDEDDDEELDEEDEEENDDDEDEEDEDDDDDEIEDDDDDEKSSKKEPASLEEIENKVKQNNYLLITLIVLNAIILLFVILNGNTKANKDEAKPSNNQQEPNKVNPEDAEFIEDGDYAWAITGKTAEQIKKASKKKAVVVWLGAGGCHFCHEYAPRLEKMTKDYKLDTYFFQVDDPATNFDELQKVLSFTGNGKWKDFGKQFNGGVPYTLVIKDGKVIGGLQGAGQAKDIEQVFKDAKLKK